MGGTDNQTSINSYEETTESGVLNIKMATRSMTHEMSGELTDALALNLSVNGANLQLSVVVVPQDDGKPLIKYQVKLESTEKGTPKDEVVVEEVFPNIEEDWHSKTYYEFAAMAADRGGRLATRGEIMQYNIIGSSKAGDQWVPVSGIKDWVQIKDGGVHASHVVDCYGYPTWGDQVTPCPFRGNSFVIARFVNAPVKLVSATEGASNDGVVVEEVFPNIGEDWHSKTYYEFAAMADKQGGRLATREEIMKHNIIGSSTAGDQWVPVSGIKDWVQIKDHRMHVSHVAGYGYPNWGDQVTPCTWRGHSYVIARRSFVFARLV